MKLTVDLFRSSVDVDAFPPGIAAYFERIFCNEFTSRSPEEMIDPESAQPPLPISKKPLCPSFLPERGGVRKSEIEVADFDRLLSKIEFLELSPTMREMLIRIKDSEVITADQGLLH